jgi:hypothetical protein
MPMIDVYAAVGTFADKHTLADDLARTLMTIEQVPDIPMFRKNTAAFVHELPNDSLSSVDGDSTYVRVEVVTNAAARLIDALTRRPATNRRDANPRHRGTTIGEGHSRQPGLWPYRPRPASR